MNPSLDKYLNILGLDATERQEFVAAASLEKFCEGEKQKRSRRAWKTAYSSKVEETGERSGCGTESVPPERRRKVL